LTGALERFQCSSSARSFRELAALDIATGKVIGECLARHRANEFLAFLKKIDREIPTHLDLHLILDNYATHKTPAVKRWLAALKPNKPFECARPCLFRPHGETEHTEIQ
jgi:DDE superfamily endonuclease